MPSLTRTLVTLEFDDGHRSQMLAVPLLARRAMHATFFVNSDRIGEEGYLSWPHLRELHATGHEVGGHSLGHDDLRKLDPAALTRAIEDDREALRGQGFPCVSFAYPYGWLDGGVREAVREAGYQSARVIHGLTDTTTLVPPGRGGIPGGILRRIDRPVLELERRAHEPRAVRSLSRASDDRGKLRIRAATAPAAVRRRILVCASLGEFAETVPPRDRYATRTVEHVMRWTTVLDLQRRVTAAERRGGWVQIVFHYIAGESAFAVQPATLAAFLDWLRARAPGGTEVKTVAEVIGDR